MTQIRAAKTAAPFAPAISDVEQRTRALTICIYVHPDGAFEPGYRREATNSQITILDQRVTTVSVSLPATFTA